MENTGVLTATICQRVSGIDGFEWSKRPSLVAVIFTNTPTMNLSETGDEISDGSVAENANGA